MIASVWLPFEVASRAFLGVASPARAELVNASAQARVVPRSQGSRRGIADPPAMSPSLIYRADAGSMIRNSPLKCIRLIR